MLEILDGAFIITFFQKLESFFINPPDPKGRDIINSLDLARVDLTKALRGEV